MDHTSNSTSSDGIHAFFKEVEEFFKDQPVPEVPLPGRAGAKVVTFSELETPRLMSLLQNLPN